MRKRLTRARSTRTGSASPYGTFDQGGNVFEWNETTISDGRGVRGGAFPGYSGDLNASARHFLSPDTENYAPALGFRLAMIPEPGTGLLVVAGLLGLAGWRRGRA